MTADTLKRDGIGHLRAGRTLDAVAALTKAAAAAPRDPGLLAVLGQAQHLAGRGEAAARTLKKAARLAPDRADLQADLGLVLTELRDLEPAVAAYRRAVALAPEDGELLGELARTLSETEALDEAAETAVRARALGPDNPEVLNSLGMVLTRRGEIEPARAAFAEAVAIAPAHAHARKNLGMMELLTGDFEAGWRDYAARHRADGTRRLPGVPEWRGEGLYGRRLVVTAEQGLGDTIQFVRFLPRLGALGARVTFLAPPALAELVATVPDAGRVVAAGGRAPKADLQCALMDIPGLLKIGRDGIPSSVPYLYADREMALPKRRAGAFAVGVVWRGNPRHRGDRHRSLAAARLLTLAGLEGVQLYSLQVDDPLPARARREGVVDLSGRLKSFADTAAAIMALDLVVSVDTAVAHLAGALGRPVSVLLPAGPDWRWQMERSDSPWYPTMTLFRQPAPGDWDTPLAALGEDLRARVDRRAA